MEDTEGKIVVARVVQTALRPEVLEDQRDVEDGKFLGWAVVRRYERAPFPTETGTQDAEESLMPSRDVAIDGKPAGESYFQTEEAALAWARTKH